jgi:hypothetical protein
MKIDGDGVDSGPIGQNKTPVATSNAKVTKSKKPRKPIGSREMASLGEPQF